MVFGCEGDRELKLAGYGNSCGDPSESFYFNLINIAMRHRIRTVHRITAFLLPAVLFAMFAPIVLLAHLLNNQALK